MGRVIVEAGNIGEMLAACLFKAFFDFLVNLFQCFDTIGGKGWCNHGYIGFCLFFGQPSYLFDRIGL